MQPAYISKLLKMNMLPTEKYTVVQQKSKPKPKLNFGIDTILTMKCSTQRKREMITKQFEQQIGKTKTYRKRQQYSKGQIERMEQVFEKSNYITCETRMDLAHELKLEVRQIKNWFQNRRFRQRQDRKYAVNSQTNSDISAESE